jgi:hypothetical protein
MTHRSYEELPAGALREHGEAAQVDHLWERIERDLPMRGRRRERRTVGVWATALGVCLFGAGVVVGSRMSSAPPQPTLVAEPVRSHAEPASPGGGILESPSQGAHEPEHVEVPRSRLPARVSAPSQPGDPLLEEPMPPVPAAPAAPPTWQLLADDGRYADALREIEQHRGFDGLLSQATAEQLMLLVDVARATGRREQAVTALRRVVNQHGTDPNAPLAAWMLGNELGRMGDSAGASQAFAMYRALSPQGDFAQDALARQFEAALEGRDLEHARALAEQYARDFPEGPRIAEMRLQLDDLRAQIQGAAELGAEPGAGDDDRGRDELPGTPAPEKPAR